MQCPVPWPITPSAELRLKEDIQTSIDGWALHQSLRQAWIDAGGGDQAAMVQFILTRARDALSLDAPDLLAEGSPDARLFAAMKDARVIRR